MLILLNVVVVDFSIVMVFCEVIFHVLWMGASYYFNFMKLVDLFRKPNIFIDFRPGQSVCPDTSRCYCVLYA